MTYKKKKNVYTWYKAVSHNYRSNIDFKGSRDKIMFLISVLLAGLMKKEFMWKKIKEFISWMFYGRLNTSRHIRKPVLECNVFKVSCASFIFINSGWDCKWRIFQKLFFLCISKYFLNR